jgi:Ca-activated chloride channel family protein
MEQACAAAELVVRRLRREDRVNVIAFDHAADALFAKPRPVESAREAAVQFIHRIRAGGGTNIALALETALRAQHSGPAPRIVLFLTDGQSDSESALRVARADAGDARVFTLGLGPGVEKPLLSRLARSRRGWFTYIESPEAIEQRVGRLFDRIESPALIGVSVEARGATLTRTYPRTLPDLSAGDDLLLAGRVMGAAGAKLELVVHGTLGGRQVAYPVSVSLPETASHPWVARSWARSRIDDLLEEMALTRDPPPELRDEVIELGIAYDLVTPYTSFLAVPESELDGDQSRSLREMRAHRAKVLAANSDAAALSRRSMPPGDPILTVTAPRDAVQVTAYFPFGLVKDLRWDERLERWAVRFLVPVEVPDGEYEARVVIVKRDGTMELAKASYVIDSQPPIFDVDLVGSHIRVHVNEPARKVTVALAADPRKRAELLGDGREFQGELPGPGTVRVVVADMARNETIREVETR